VNATPPYLLTVAEVARYLRVSDMTVYRLLQDGTLPCIRIGKSYRIRADTLKEFLGRSEG